MRQPARRRNFSPWAYFRLRQEATADTDPMPGDDAALDAWRARVRARLLERLGPWPDPVPLDVEVLAEDAGAGYVRREIVFDSERFMSVPAILLVPDGRTAPGPAVVAIHGHGTDKDVGYAYALAQAGFVVLAPDLRGFGVRADRPFGEPAPDDFAGDIVFHHFHCDEPMVCAVMTGTWPLTLNLWDLRCAIDVLAQHELVDADRIGCAGWSYGGTLSLLLAAVDERVRAAVVSCFFSSWRTAHALPWNMCGSQVLWSTIGQLEHVDVAALLAPRGLAVENGVDDELFSADVAKAGVDQLRRVYRHAGAEDRLLFDGFPGGHEWNGRATIPFLQRSLT